MGEAEDRVAVESCMKLGWVERAESSREEHRRARTLCRWLKSGL